MIDNAEWINMGKDRQWFGQQRMTDNENRHWEMTDMAMGIDNGNDIQWGWWPIANENQWLMIYNTVIDNG